MSIKTIEDNNFIRNSNFKEDYDKFKKNKKNSFLDYTKDIVINSNKDYDYFSLQKTLIFKNLVNSVQEEIIHCDRMSTLLDKTRDWYYAAVEKRKEYYSMPKPSDLECYDLVNNAETSIELEDAIALISVNNTVKGKSQIFPVNELIESVRLIIHSDGYPNYLTRVYGIRQQALYIKYYNTQ